MKHGSSDLRWAWAWAGCLIAAHGLAADPVDISPRGSPHPGIYWKPAEGVTIQPSPMTQPPQAPRGPVTLAELTDLALRNHPSTREAWATARAEAEGIGIAQSRFWPDINFEMDASHNDGSNDGRDSTSNSNNSRARTRFSPALSLTYVLFDSGARTADVTAARYGTLAANLTQNRTLQEVVLNVEQSYYQLLGTSQLVDAAKESVTRAQATLDAASARREAGLATLGDVYQAETALAQAVLDLRRAEGQTASLRGSLANAVGLPVNAVLELSPVQEKPPVTVVSRSVEAILAEAKGSRPDLAAAEAQVRAARARVDAAAAAGRPVLEANAGTGYTFGPGSTADGSHLNVGITLRIPLFNGRRTLHTVKQAEARTEQFEANRDRLSQQVELDVWRAYFDLQTATATIDSADTLLKSARQSREVAHGRYNSGVGTLLDLLTSQAAEADARAQAIQAQLGWYSALSRLNNAIGTLTPAIDPQNLQ